ncbi:MAG: sulfite exporter TauE/SafE family protein, partial [Gammaproteobacteria bacterium]
MNEVFGLSLLAGALAGLLAGLFGIGGGVVLVPILALLFAAHGFPSENIMIMAVATSLATIVITSSASILAHHRLGSLVWRKVFRLAPGIMLGSALGAAAADSISADVLRHIFAAYLCWVGVQMALQIAPAEGSKRSANLDWPVAIGIGILSALLGIGGGTLTVPYLVKCRYPMRNAVAISSACGLPIAVAGTVSYALLGRAQVGLPEGSLGYVYLPAFVGIIMFST